MLPSGNASLFDWPCTHRRLRRGLRVKRTEGDKLYQGIKANRTADDIPNRAKSEGSETLIPKGRVGGRHIVDETAGSLHLKVFM